MFPSVLCGFVLNGAKSDAPLGEGGDGFVSVPVPAGVAISVSVMCVRCMKSAMLRFGNFGCTSLGASKPLGVHQVGASSLA